MVKVSYMPWKEVIIHEIIFHERLDDLIKGYVAGAPVGSISIPLLWAEGVVFRHDVIQASTNSIVKEQLEGKVHWSHVRFSFMPVFRPEIEIPEGAIKVPIINVERNPSLRDVAKWLKEYAEALP